MQKWYLGAAVVCLISGLYIIAHIDQTQPASVNVPLTNNIVGILTMALTFFFGQLANSAKIEKKAEEVKQTVQEAPAQVVQAAVEAKAVVSEAATQAADKLTKSADAAANKLQGG